MSKSDRLPTAPREKATRESKIEAREVVAVETIMLLNNLCKTPVQDFDCWYMAACDGDLPLSVWKTGSFVRWVSSPRVVPSH